MAPFYYDWPLEIAVLGTDSKQVRHTVRPECLLTALLAGDSDRNWSHAIPANTLEPGTCKLLLRVVNPLAGGMALRFSNTTQDAGCRPDGLASA